MDLRVLQTVSLMFHCVNLVSKFVITSVVGQMYWWESQVNILSVDNYNIISIDGDTVIDSYTLFNTSPQGHCSPVTQLYSNKSEVLLLFL